MSDDTPLRYPAWSSEHGMLTVAQAADFLNCTVKHLHHAIRNKAIGHVLGPSPHRYSRRTIRYVSRAELLSVRADGFFREKT